MKMFARRHPILFFFIMISSCFTIVIMGFIVLAVVSTGFMGEQYARQASISAGNVGVVEVNGMILSSKKVIQDIKAFHENDGIKAIILRIESPGGGIGPSQEIYREINKVKKDKRIVASMGAVAASGGYYIASATDKIVANPGTLTGSIGVIMEYANLMEIAKKIGVSPVVVKSGEFKDMGSPLRELKESEKAIFQDLVDELHGQFVQDVARARNIDYQKIANLADGRVYTGQKALKLKLVDRLGNLDDAVQLAGELAGIKGELKPVYPKEDKITFLRKLAESVLKNVNLSGAVNNNLKYIIK